jgi:hypothetical protein
MCPDILADFGGKVVEEGECYRRYATVSLWLFHVGYCAFEVEADARNRIEVKKRRGNAKGF